MAAFSQSNYSASAYAAQRPTYPSSLYDQILSYHRGPRSLCLDLGCGHGLVTRSLAPKFERIIGIDPSRVMLDEARSLTDSSTFPNVEYHESNAESLPFIEDHSVDLVVAGQAAHWFNQPLFFAELRRVMKPSSGTLAFWSYKEHVFVDYPIASQINYHYVIEPGTGLLGDYWSQPGHDMVQDHLRAITPPEEDWEDIQREEYEPGTKGPRSGQGELIMAKRLKLGQCREYVRTHSVYHAWKEAHPGVKSSSEGGKGDIVDEMFEKMVEREQDWQQAEPSWKEFEVDVEWGTGLIMARRKEV
ncbi:MAG: hypothetical protein M1823_000073 [Watsoniomyces obsoletus]|nr:MAG: hypothetical protein M1823_000073 [Watsoniomyces obsoletus]